MSYPRDWNFPAGLASPAAKSVAITPADADLADGIARGLYVGGTGNVTIQNQDGTTCVFTSVPAGSFLPVCCKQVRAATTATAIVALF